VVWTPRTNLAGSLRQQLAQHVHDHGATATFEADLVDNAKRYAPPDNRTAIVEAIQMKSLLEPGFHAQLAGDGD